MRHEPARAADGSLERWTVDVSMIFIEFRPWWSHTRSEYGRRGRRLSSLLLGSQGAGHYRRGHAQVTGQPN